jgi:hypothetical protein
VDRSQITRLAWGILVLVAALLLARGAQSGIDFHVFYQAGVRLRAGIPIYQLADGWMPFKYFPAWPVLFAGFTFVPEVTANVIFNAVQLSCWLYAAAIWSRWLGYAELTSRALLVVVVCALGPLATETRWVQLNGMLFLAATKLCQWSSRKTHPFASGALSLALCSLKLNYGLLAIHTFRRNRKYLLGSLLAALGLHLVVVAFYGGLGVNIYRQWISVTLTQSNEQLSSPHVQGLLRFFLSIAGGYGRLLWLISLPAFIFIGLKINRAKTQEATSGVFWIANTFLLSPLAWWYQDVFMLPMAFFVLRNQISRAEACIVWAILVSYATITPDILGYELFVRLADWNVLFLGSAVLYTLFLKCFASPRASGYKCESLMPRQALGAKANLTFLKRSTATFTLGRFFAATTGKVSCGG